MARVWSEIISVTAALLAGIQVGSRAALARLTRIGPQGQKLPVVSNEIFGFVPFSERTRV